VIFPSAEKNFKRNFWNLRGFFQKIGFFVQALSTAEATAEASRQLNIYATPRTIYGFEGFSQCLDLVLGQAVTLTHARFGLSVSKTGIVTKLQPDWINLRVQVEVMI